MNPYAKELGDRDAVAVMAATPARIRAEVARIGVDAFTRTYEEGKWNIAQILTHLAQGEIAFSQRVRQALTVNDYVAQPFDQDDWMNSETMIDGATALEAFCSLRQFNLLLYQNLTAAQRETALVNPAMGPQTVNLILEIIAGHDLNHLAQLESMSAR